MYIHVATVLNKLQDWTSYRINYSRNCFLRPPLDAAKASLKQQVVCETRVAKTCPCEVNTFFSLKSKWKAFSDQSQSTCSCMHWYLTSLVFKVYTKGGSMLSVIPYSGTHVNGSVHAKSGWSRSAGSRFLHKIIHAWNLVIKTRCSLTTEI